MLRRALAPAAVLVLVTACSGRANDLDTYYDEPITAPVLTSEPVAAPTTPAQAATAATTTTEAAPAADPESALLTDDDLAEEGVTTIDGKADASGDCVPDAIGAWRYPSGSVIEQTVAVLPDAASRVAAMRGEGACLPSTTSDGPGVGQLGDDSFSWCFTGAEVLGCAVAIAQGDLLTVVTVEAGSTQRASDAVSRVAPLAADALARAQED